ncbi:MAG: RND transporter [Thiogranum sp.]|nr:RND transporter [Thiogranum sp.]
MKWLDRISLPVLAAVALLLALAPFTPEPHLLEKSRMLLEGALVKPIDIFDLVFHAAPLVLLILKLLRHKRAS